MMSLFPSPTMSEANSVSHFLNLRLYLFTTSFALQSAGVMVASHLTYCECFDFEYCLGRSGCSAIIHNLVFGSVVCCMEVGYNGILGIPGVLTCDVVDIIINERLSYFVDKKVGRFCHSVDVAYLPHIYFFQRGGVCNTTTTMKFLTCY
jgi:hypothetical protein